MVNFCAYIWLFQAPGQWGGSKRGLGEKGRGLIESLEKAKCCAKEKRNISLYWQKKNTPREPTIRINFRRSRDFCLRYSGLEERDISNKLVIEPLTKTLDIRDIINHQWLLILHIKRYNESTAYLSFKTETSWTSCFSLAGEKQTQYHLYLYK